MRRSKFSPQQIAKILKEFDNGKSVDQISREHAVSAAVKEVLPRNLFITVSVGRAVF